MVNVGQGNAIYLIHSQSPRIHFKQNRSNQRQLLWCEKFRTLFKLVGDLGGGVVDWEPY